MATELFTWSHRFAPVGAIKHRVLTAQFGDGYRQTAGDGINTKTQTWPLEFVAEEATITAIAAFLDAHAGARTFLWKPPLGQMSLWEAAEYSVTPQGGGVYSLTVTFIQAFRP